MFHKCIKPLGGNHHGLGDYDMDLVKLLVNRGKSLQQAGHKSQPPGFASQGTRSDFKKFRIEIEFAGLEVDHDPFLAMAAPGLDDGYQIFPMTVDTGKIIISYGPDLGCQCNFSAGKNIWAALIIFLRLQVVSA